ncbi:MAG TPA: hypothetical protein PKY88_12875 [Anaerohalosphaeraceae bacterium]|nr:hypothetical protein [Anaerohalosphaeraceae bacterium]
MKEFIDSTGRKWVLSLTIDAVKRCRDLLNINLLEPEKGDPPLLTRIGTDEILFCDLLYCLCKPQLDQAGITDEQFGQALGGDAIRSASHAFYEEMIDFFQKRGRSDRAKAVAKQRQVIDLAVRTIEQTLDAVDLETEVVKALGSVSTNSPGSSGSIRDR